MLVKWDLFVCVQAVRTSIYGRPGPCYVEMPGNLVTDSIEEELIRLGFLQ